MWKERLRIVLEAPFDLLALQVDPGQPFRGRYLRLNGKLFGLGSNIAQGAEAMVYQLINLEDGEFDGVIKICRYSPGSAEYRRWAVPVRFEGNPHSANPRIEMHSAKLVRIDGGFVKLQQYISDNWKEDWSTLFPARPIFLAYRKSPDEALLKAQELVESYGPRGVFLEMQGRILAELDRMEEAREVLERCLECYRTESRSGMLRTGILLANIHRAIFQSNRWKGAAAVVTLDVPDGPSANQVIFSSPEEAALDDMLEDRSLYILLEILAIEPYFIPALFMLAEEMGSSQVTWNRVSQVLDAIDRADPGRKDVSEFRQNNESRVQRFFDHLLSIAVKPTQEDEAHAVQSVDESKRGDTADASRSRNFEDHLRIHNRIYQPEPQRAQSAEARMDSALANLRAGRIEEAVRAARDSVKIGPTNAQCHLTLTRVLRAIEKYDEAGNVLRGALERFPDHHEFHEAQGELYLDLKQPEEARISFLRALLSQPIERWPIDLGLGRAYRQLGDRRQAIDHLRAAYTDAGDRPFVALQLAYALRENQTTDSRDFMEAIRVIDGAIEQQPANADLLVCQAQLLAASYRIQDAIQALERAVELEPKHPFAADFVKKLKTHVENS